VIGSEGSWTSSSPPEPNLWLVAQPSCVRTRTTEISIWLREPEPMAHGEDSGTWNMERAKSEPSQ
jgi:hypothetical protein